MAKAMFDVQCPCCDAVLRIDAETRAIIAHTIPQRPKPIEDLAAEVVKLKGEEARRDEVFQKQVEAQKSHGKVLEKKFEELFKRAKDNPDAPPIVRDIDLD
ncbi:MAG: hypothetical protein ACLQKA_15850 [Bryobacteraceae bacterium]